VAGCGENSMKSLLKKNAPRYDIGNDKYAILHDERIYYSYSSGFFSMNTDGSDRKMLNDVFARYMHIVNDRIYFSNSNYRGYIYSMNIDGTDLQQLNEDGVSGLTVIDDWVYYNISRSSDNQYGKDGMGIYKMRTDGIDRLFLTDDEVVYFNVEGDKIYYEASGEYLSISIDGKNRQQEFYDWTSPAHTKRLRYFFDEDNRKLYCMRNDGSDRRQLSKNEWIVLFGGPVADRDDTYCVFIFKTEY